MTLSGVSRTAFGVARVRASESARPDALFHDPLASAFLAAEPPHQPEPRRHPTLRDALAVQIALRTRFYDDYLLDATAGGVRQIVLLAAGLDARAFRLDWPTGTRIFEIDLPAMQAHKAAVLSAQSRQPRADRRVLAADLLGDWAAPLRQAGFTSGQPTAWLIEGLLVYLDHAGAAHVLSLLTDLSAPGSRLACERSIAREILARHPRLVVVGEVAALWQGGLAGDPLAWLAERGWQATEHPLAEVGLAHSRAVSERSASGFITATFAPV